ncbi:MAG TPA: serine/threonine-protein kinase [Kofleriaceae bacterium]|nr:serine/threonine-protein kinase [Kofleriaceae bacterium]
MGAAAPERFGRYEVVRELGGGAMGEVYQARDAALGRDVAIKVMRRAPGVAAELFRARFDAEARALAALRHAAVVSIYDVGWDGDDPYLVMELVPGGSLRDRISAGPLPDDEVRGLAIAIAGALDAAHGAGILHRDVKPANVLGRAGEWKLADFGIAHVPGSELTMTGQFLGTPAYAAPEALGEGLHTTAADLWGLGATLYAAMTGAPPYGGSLGAAASTSYVPLVSKNSSPLAHLVDDLLSRDPSRRPTAAQVLATLHAPSAPVRPALSPERSRRGSPSAARTESKNPPWLWIGLAAAVLAIGLVALAASSGSRDRGSAPSAAAPIDLPTTTPAPNGAMVSYDPSTGAITIDRSQLTGDRSDKTQHKLDDAVREAEDGHLDPALDKLADVLDDNPDDEPVQTLRATLQQLRGEDIGDRGPPGRRKHKKHDD